MNPTDLNQLHQWTRSEALELIKVYREHSELWCVKNSKHNDREAKNQAWNQIAERMGMDVFTVRKKITNLLRDYRRRLKRKLIAPKKRIKWFAFNSMSFLKKKNCEVPESTAMPDNLPVVPSQEDSNMFSIKQKKGATIKEILSQLSLKCCVEVTPLTEDEIKFHTRRRPTKKKLVFANVQQKPNDSLNTSVVPLAQNNSNDTNLQETPGAVSIDPTNCSANVPNSDNLNKMGIKRKVGPKSLKHMPMPKRFKTNLLNKLKNKEGVVSSTQELTTAAAQETHANPQKKVKRNMNSKPKKQPAENVSNGSVAIAAEQNILQNKLKNLITDILNSDFPHIGKISQGHKDNLIGDINQNAISLEFSRKNNVFPSTLPPPTSEIIKKTSDYLDRLSPSAKGDLESKGHEKVLAMEANLIRLDADHFSPAVISKIVNLSNIYAEAFNVMTKYDSSISEIKNTHLPEAVKNERISVLKKQGQDFLAATYSMGFSSMFSLVVQSFGIAFRWELVIILYCKILQIFYERNRFNSMIHFFEARNLMSFLLSVSNYKTDLVHQVLNLEHKMFSSLVTLTCKALKIETKLINPSEELMTNNFKPQVTSHWLGVPSVNNSSQSIPQNPLLNNVKSTGVAPPQSPITKEVCRCHYCLSGYSNLCMSHIKVEDNIHPRTQITPNMPVGHRSANFTSQPPSLNSHPQNSNRSKLMNQLLQPISQSGMPGIQSFSQMNHQQKSTVIHHQNQAQYATPNMANSNPLTGFENGTMAQKSQQKTGQIRNSANQRDNRMNTVQYSHVIPPGNSSISNNDQYNQNSTQHGYLKGSYCGFPPSVSAPHTIPPKHSPSRQVKLPASQNYDGPKLPVDHSQYLMQNRTSPVSQNMNSNYLVDNHRHPPNSSNGSYAMGQRSNSNVASQPFQSQTQGQRVANTNSQLSDRNGISKQTTQGRLAATLLHRSNGPKPSVDPIQPPNHQTNFNYSSDNSRPPAYPNATYQSAPTSFPNTQPFNSRQMATNSIGIRNGQLTEANQSAFTSPDILDTKPNVNSSTNILSRYPSANSPQHIPNESALRAMAPSQPKTTTPERMSPKSDPSVNFKIRLPSLPQKEIKQTSENEVTTRNSESTVIQKTPIKCYNNIKILPSLLNSSTKNETTYDVPKSPAQYSPNQAKSAMNIQVNSSVMINSLSNVSNKPDDANREAVGIRPEMCQNLIKSKEITINRLPDMPTLADQVPQSPTFNGNNVASNKAAISTSDFDVSPHVNVFPVTKIKTELSDEATPAEANYQASLSTTPIKSLPGSVITPTASTQSARSSSMNENVSRLPNEFASANGSAVVHPQSSPLNRLPNESSSQNRSAVVHPQSPGSLNGTLNRLKNESPSANGSAVVHPQSARSSPFNGALNRLPNESSSANGTTVACSSKPSDNVAVVKQEIVTTEQNWTERNGSDNPPMNMNNLSGFSCNRSNCSNPASVLCSGCNRALYCGAECQTLDWYDQHVSVCGTSSTSSEQK